MEMEKCFFCDRLCIFSELFVHGIHPMCFMCPTNFKRPWINYLVTKEEYITKYYCPHCEAEASKDDMKC